MIIDLETTGIERSSRIVSAGVLVDDHGFILFLYDDEETLQYEVVCPISGNLLATFQTEPEARTYATKLDVAQQATKPMTTLRLWPRDILEREPPMW